MYRRLVVKLGTSVLTRGTRRLNRPQMLELVRQCAEAHGRGLDVVICTSGAIAAGRETLDFPELSPTLTNKQMLAAVGQTRLMLAWQRLFEIYDIRIGQMLLTRADMDDRHRFLNARDTLQSLLAERIIPVVNENDAVATDEIKVGDNDNLSALVAILAEADLLLLLTDQSGLFTADPRVQPEAELIPEVRDIDESIRRLAGGSVSGLGVGGMATKLQAADLARRAGADVVIASGRTEGVIADILAGRPRGTRFPALDTPLESRKRWILAGAKPSGRLHLDPGAVEALARQGKSLLAAGIRRVDHRFERGDTVALLGPDAAELGRGISRYSSEALERIQGRHSRRIEELLGYSYGPAVVHRNDLVLL